MSRQDTVRNKIDLTLLAACYNEELNFIGTLETVQAALKEFDDRWEIAIIDDASRDNLVAVVQDYLRRHPELPIRLYVNPVNKGLGAELRGGVSLGLARLSRRKSQAGQEPGTFLHMTFWGFER